MLLRLSSEASRAALPPSSPPEVAWLGRWLPPAHAQSAHATRMEPEERAWDFRTPTMMALFTRRGKPRSRHRAAQIPWLLPRLSSPPVAGRILRRRTAVGVGHGCVTTVGGRRSTLGWHALPEHPRWRARHGLTSPPAWAPRAVNIVTGHSATRGRAVRWTRGLTRGTGGPAAAGDGDAAHVGAIAVSTRAACDRGSAGRASGGRRRARPLKIAPHGRETAHLRTRAIGAVVRSRRRAAAAAPTGVPSASAAATANSSAPTATAARGPAAAAAGRTAAAGRAAAGAGAASATGCATAAKGPAGAAAAAARDVDAGVVTGGVDAIAACGGEGHAERRYSEEVSALHYRFSVLASWARAWPPKARWELVTLPGSKQAGPSSHLCFEVSNKVRDSHKRSATNP